MNEEPLVSIIMPVYNAENYLRNSLDDIINQTYANWELLCVNDGSVDSSIDIIKEYQSKDNRVGLVNQANSGVGVARNNGLKEAHGKYVLFLDSDDRLSTQLIETCVNMSEKNVNRLRVYD